MIMTERGFCQELDPLSNYFVVTTHPRFKNLFGVALVLKGHVDEAAVSVAFNSTIKNYPHLFARVQARRGVGGYRLDLEADTEFQPKYKTTRVSSPDPSVPIADRVLHEMRATLEKEWDPFRNGKAEFHHVQVDEKQHVLYVTLNHFMADPWILSRFGREFLVNFSTALTGDKPAWVSQAHITSVLKKERVNHYRKRRLERAGPRTPNRGKELRFALRAVGMLLLDKPGIVTGRGSKTATIDHHVRRSFSREETEKLATVSSTLGVSLTDRMVWASNLAIDKWNAMHNTKPQTINTFVSTLMRGREATADTPSNVSAIFLRSTPQHRKDPGAFLTWAKTTRRRKLLEKEDLILRKIASIVYRVLRIIPPKIAAKFMRPLVRKRIFSLSIANVGIVWPELDGAKLTGGSYLVKAGEVEVTELHAFAQGMACFSTMLLICHIFRNRLHVLLNASPSLYSKDEIETIADLIVKTLRTRI